MSEVAEPADVALTREQLKAIYDKQKEVRKHRAPEPHATEYSRNHSHAFKSCRLS